MSTRMSTGTRLAAAIAAAAIGASILTGCSSEPTGSEPTAEPTTTTQTIETTEATSAPEDITPVEDTTGEVTDTPAVDEPDVRETVAPEDLAGKAPGVYDLEPAPDVNAGLGYASEAATEEYDVGGVVPGTGEGVKDNNPGVSGTGVFAGDDFDWDTLRIDAAWWESEGKYIFPHEHPELKFGEDERGRLVVIE